MSKKVEKNEAKKILQIINEGLGEAKLIATSSVREDDKVNLIFEYNDKFLVCRFSPFVGEIDENDDILEIDKSEVQYYV